jgi:hypothetical protein
MQLLLQRFLQDAGQLAVVFNNQDSHSPVLSTLITLPEDSLKTKAL